MKADWALNGSSVSNPNAGAGLKNVFSYQTVKLIVEF
jgi:hypothetical protein